MSEFRDIRMRAVLGTLGLHFVLYATVFVTPVRLQHIERAIVPIVLVERLESVPEEPELVVEIPNEVDADTGQLERVPKEENAELETQNTTPDLPADPPSALEAASLPLAPTVELSTVDTNDTDAIIIDPQYEIPYEPFAETPPSAMTRATIAAMCTRASTATRPDFCPGVSSEDGYFSSLDAPPGWASSAYDPVFDVVPPQSVLVQVVQGFIAGQAKHGTRSGSPELEPITQVPRHPEALPCSPVQTGLQGPGGVASGLELRLGSTDGIQCR